MVPGRCTDDGLDHRAWQKVNGNLVAEYTWGLLGPLMRRPSNVNNIRYYIQDGLGHTRALLDNASNVTDWYVYDAWGGLNNSLSSTPTANPFRWNGAYGYEWIPITGLYHVGAREYDPRVGRWLQRDPIDVESGDPNLYRYCGNDPINCADPDGLIYRDPKTGARNWTDWSHDAANFFAGWGDRLAPFGFTGWVREGLGVNDIIDPCNEWYLVGHVVGAGHSLALGRGGGGGASRNALRQGGSRAGSQGNQALRNYAGDNPYARRGREAHEQFKQKVKQKEDRGWRAEPTITNPNTGEKMRPDAITPSRHPIELKPNTPSGKRRGKQQIKKYEEALGKKGKVIYYDP